MSFDIQTKDSGVIWTPPDDVKGRKVSTAWHPFWRVFLGNRVFVPVATVVKVSRRRQKLVHWTGLKHSRRKKNHIYWRNITKLFISNGGTRWRSWLRHCATSGKVAGSIPSGVIGIFHWHNPSCRTMALGSTLPPTEMSTRNIFWGGKGGRFVGLTTLSSYWVLVTKSGSLKLLEPSGPVQACNGIA